jgi:hypothetical protein
MKKSILFGKTKNLYYFIRKSSLAKVTVCYNFSGTGIGHITINGQDCNEYLQDNPSCDIPLIDLLNSLRFY